MPLEPMQRDLFDAKDAAILLHVSPQTVVDYVRQGHLKAAWVGRKYLIPKTSIEAFIEARLGHRKVK
jgi:excisionase family DNA binding protein